jgi:hypothetical protein
MDKINAGLAMVLYKIEGQINGLLNRKNGKISEDSAG